jgi:hypothetical protein
MLLRCSSVFRPREPGTFVEIRLRSWWELLAAGVPLLLGSVLVWYLGEWEQDPRAHAVPGLVAWLYSWVAFTGVAFSGAGLWKLRRLRDQRRAAPPA